MDKGPERSDKMPSYGQGNAEGGFIPVIVSGLYGGFPQDLVDKPKTGYTEAN